MSYKEQFIWNRSVDLAVKCYFLTSQFPRFEFDGLTPQIRRASVSVASNIAEGYGRRTTKDYLRFLHIALGSLRELDTQLIIASRVKLVNQELLNPVLNDVEEMQKILVSTINKIKITNS